MRVGMAYDMRYQMNCCIACGGPLFPSKEVLRLDKVGSRSFMYLEKQVMNDGNEWGLAPNTDVKLLSELNELHMIPRTNSAPVLNEFINGRMYNLWAHEETPGNPLAHVDNIPRNTVMDPSWFWIRSPDGNGNDEYRAVFWGIPTPINGFQNLGNCLRDCIYRISDTPRLPPDISLTVQGCAECNHIMTQEGCMRHLLARNIISPVPLVPLNSIYRYNLSKNPSSAGITTISSGRQRDPNAANKSNKYFSFQACIAYYIHRCLPDRPAGGIAAYHTEARDLQVLFAYLLLMILSLMYERFHGKKGGKARREKPAYRYKGLVELYVSYIIYMLLSNDSAFGEDNGRNAVGLQNMSFPIFHKYWFGEFFNILVSFETDLSHYTEISDIIFTSDWARGGSQAFIPSPSIKMARPEIVIGFLATSIAEFYSNRVRPYFSRHICGLNPKVPRFVNPLDTAIYNMQISIRKIILNRQNLDVFFHLCDNSAPNDIDSFMNHVGVRAVTKTWCEMLKIAPNKMDRLLGQFIEAWTCCEYQHILGELNADSDQPRLPPRVAESVYLLCYSLDSLKDPVNDKDLEELRMSPRCSDYLAALRLDMAGAFNTEDE